jgi:hypothetical protein
MKKLYKLIFALTLLFSIISFTTEAQTARNPVLETCTGTWCQWCPCGHTAIRDVVLLYNPNAIIISYHGPTNSSDPYRVFNGNTILSSLGFSSYPSGIVDRLTVPQSRTAWAGQVYNRSFAAPKVSIEGEIGFQRDSNKIFVHLTVKALDVIAEIPVISFVLTENKLLSPQTGNSSCTGGNEYVHNYVVRSMLNGPLGSDLAKTGWTIGDTAVVDTFFYVPSNVLSVNNIDLNALVYSKKAPLNQSEIHQGRKWKVTDFPVGVKEFTNTTPESFDLQQNYPNPFNPETKVTFSVPKSGFVLVKVFDLLGKEVAVIASGEMVQGTYTKSLNASNLPSGVYIYQLEAEGVKISRKMSLLK